MLVPLTPFVWSFIQVALLATTVLMICWSMRGRRPQWTSAMLAGSCMAALALTGLAWLPVSHWSVAEFTANYSSEALANNSNGTQETLPRASSNTHAHLGNAAQDATAELLNEPTLATSSSVVGEWFSATTSWLSFNLQGIDANLRDFESHTAQKSANFWRLQMLSVVIIALLGALWLHSWLWIRFIVRHSVPIEDSHAVARLEELSKRMGLTRLPQLLESNRVAIGATVGAWHHRLILNANWRQWSDAELEVVLLHELAHMLRHDYAWVVLGSWIRMLLFYHPFIHVLVRRWRMEQELAADQLAAGAMQNARAYGRALARLALRAQGGVKVPGPALTAEQVCIVRRITMLKQGSLKPLKNRGRWSAVVIALTIVVTAPLSSLRGTPPGTPAPGSVGDTKAGDKTAESAKNDALLERQKETILTQKEFPPVSYVGNLKWEPRKLLSDDVSPSLRYMQDLVAFVLFEQFPEKAKLSAPANATMNWETRQRERGMLTFGATCNESQGIDPQFILRMLSNPRFTNYKPSSETKMIAGRQATRLIAKGMNPTTRIVADDTDPNCWFVQDGEGFFFGTEEEVLNQIERRKSPDPDVALIEVPEAFRQDYAEAALALVYDDCEQWSDRFRDFFAGSPKQAELILIQPYLKGVKQIGLFITGQSGATIDIRIGYQSESAAKDGAEAIDAMLGLMKATASADPSDPFTARFLNAMKIRTVESEVRLRFNDNELVDKFCDMILPEKVVGWTDILSLLEPSDVPGTAKVVCRDHFALTGFLAQSIQAKNYRGQRVRISAEIGGDEDVHTRCGTIVWGSNAQLQTVGNVTSGKTIGTPTDLQKVLKAWTKPAEEVVLWQTKTVEWNVPANADALSFGVYLAAGEVQVRNLKFEVVGPATSDQAETELANLPRNLLQIPGRKLLDEPTNLDFSQKPTPVESTSVQTADREALPGKSELRR